MYSENFVFSPWLFVIFIYAYAFYAQYAVLLRWFTSIVGSLRVTLHLFDGQSMIFQEMVCLEQTKSLEEINLKKKLKEIANLEEKAKPLMNPNDFAEYAKMQRKIGPLRDDAAALEQAVKFQKSKQTPPWLQLRGIQVLLFLIMMYCTYGLSLAPIPMGMQSIWFSNITSTKWMVICYAVIRRCS